jgi:hypothetical protein
MVRKDRPDITIEVHLRGARWTSKRQNGQSHCTGDVHDMAIHDHAIKLRPTDR